MEKKTTIHSPIIFFFLLLKSLPSTNYGYQVHYPDCSSLPSQMTQSFKHSFAFTILPVSERIHLSVIFLGDWLTSFSFPEENLRRYTRPHARSGLQLHDARSKKRREMCGRFHQFCAIWLNNRFFT